MKRGIELWEQFLDKLSEKKGERIIFDESNKEELVNEFMLSVDFAGLIPKN